MNSEPLAKLYDDERLIDFPLIDSQIENEHRHRYEAAANFVINKRVLDAACGSGYGSEILAANAKSVVGIDYSSEVISYCNSSKKSSNIEYLQMSVIAMDFPDNSFDIVVSFETYEHLTANDQERFLQEIKRVLTPDGILIISSPNHGVWNRLIGGNNEYHLNELTVKELEHTLKAYFSQVNTYYQNYIPVSIISAEFTGVDLKTIYSRNFDTSVPPVYGIALCSDFKITNSFDSVYLQNFMQAQIQLKVGLSDMSMYCDCGKGFCEADKLKAPLEYLSDGKLRITFKLPAHVNALRFDPGELPCIISDLTCSDNKLCCQPQNGILLKNKEVLFYTPDPIFLINGRDHYNENEYIVLSFYYSKLDEATSKFIENQNELLVQKERNLIELNSQLQDALKIIQKNACSESESVEKIHRLQIQNITYIAENAKLSMKVEQLESEIEYKKNSIVELADENDKLQKAYEKAETDKLQIFHSRWYKITKPGRIITSFIRKILKL